MAKQGTKRGRTGRGGARRTRKRTMVARPFPYRRMQVANIHHFKRMISNPGSLQGAVGYAPYTSNFYLNGLTNLPNYLEFTNLYEQFRINYCVWKVWLRIDPSAQTATNASYPKFYWCRTDDSTSTPGTLDVIRERQNSRVKVLTPNRPITVKFRPNVLGAAYQTAVSTAYTPKWKQWIDCGNSSTVHYGFGWAIDNLTNTNYYLDFEISVYFSCKNSR